MMYMSLLVMLPILREDRKIQSKIWLSNTIQAKGLKTIEIKAGDVLLERITLSCFGSSF